MVSSPALSLVTKVPQRRVFGGVWSTSSPGWGSSPRRRWIRVGRILSPVLSTNHPQQQVAICGRYPSACPRLQRLGFLREADGGSVGGLPADTPQYGFLRSKTEPAPASGQQVTTSYVYDRLGRGVGLKRTGDADWTCTVFDTRGRDISVTYPATATTAARTVTSSFTSNATIGGTLGADPLTSWTEDEVGRITVVTDLLGSVVSYRDVWGTVTTISYDLQ